MTAPATASISARASVRPRRLAAPVLLALVGLAAWVVSLGLDLVTTADERTAAQMGWGSASGAVGLVPATCAIPILARYPRHAVGWVLAATGLVWCLDGLAESWAAHAIAASPNLPLAGVAVWFVAQVGSVLLVALPLVLVLYPTGRLIPGRWGRFSVLVIILACLLPALLTFAPSSVVSADIALPIDTGMPELPMDQDTFMVLLRVSQVLTLLSLPLAVLVVFVRQRRADGPERVQLRWLVWAAVTCLMVTALALVHPNGLLTTLALVVCLSVTCVSVTIGILRPDLTDVDALMGGTLVYAGVAVVVIGLDLGLLAVVDQALGERLTQRDATLLVLLVAVAAYGPLRTWISGLVRRLLVGRRGDRYDVIAGLAEELEQADDVRVQLPALATAVATTFKLRYVRVEVLGHSGDTLSATHGTPPSVTREVPIRYGDHVVGRLVLPAQGIRSMLSRRDQELLFDVVRQAAMAVRSSRLATDLQHSREQLVLAREEDRRRIRRDLHDGLGPVLGGVAMRLDAAGNALSSDPETARDLLSRSRVDVTEALADVRRLVYGLRPPALDDLGLLPALEQHVDRTRRPGFDVRVEAAALPELSAAVEVAAFRIATESLTNTVRHAAAAHCVLRLEGRGDVLLVETLDDGVGIGPDVVAGVGLRSIRERAEELGGHVEITCPPEGGTRVRAWLPLDPAPEEIR